MALKDIIECLESVRTPDNVVRHKDRTAAELKALKQDFIQSDKQEEAKLCWCLERVLESQILYLSAFDKMKAGQFYKAWCDLADCEKSLHFLQRHFRFDDYGFMLQFVDSYVGKFQSLFPYTTFTSSEMLISEFQCSICDKKMSLRNPCGHRVGEIYNGEMCGRIPKGIELLGVAIVSSPVDKCLVFPSPNSPGGIMDDSPAYSLVGNVISNLRSPYDVWEVEKTTKSYQHSQFSALGRNDRCPCGSRKKYKRCCLEKPAVLMPHYVFKFPADRKDVGLE